MKSVSEIINSIKNSLESTGSALGKFSRYSNIYALLRAIASTIAEQEFELAKAKQASYALTAVAEDLDMKALDFGIARKQGTRAQGWVLTSSSQATYNLPRGTILTTADSQFQYETLADVFVTSVEAPVEVRSLVIGTDSNIESQTRLYSSIFPGIQFTVGKYRSPITQKAEVGITDGTNAEQDEALRGRLLNYIQSIQQGTLKSVTNAVLSVNGVTKAFIREHSPITGYITVFVDSKDTRVLNAVEEEVNKTKAAGVSYFIRSIESVGLNVNVVIRVMDLANSTEVANQIKALTSNYFNGLELGESFDPIALTAALMQIRGIKSVRVISPDFITPSSGTLLSLANLSITLQN